MAFGLTPSTQGGCKRLAEGTGVWKGNDSFYSWSVGTGTQPGYTLKPLQGSQELRCPSEYGQAPPPSIRQA